MNLLSLVLLTCIAQSYAVIIIGSVDGAIHCLDGRTGNERWSFDSGGALARASGHGNVIPSLDGSLYSLKNNGRIEV